MTKIEILNQLDAIERQRKALSIIENGLAEINFDAYKIVATATTKLIKLETKLIKQLKKADI